MNRPLQSHNGIRGSVLIVVLIVCLGLVSMTLVLGHSMLMAYRGSDNEVAGRQADLAIEGAAQYAQTLLSNVDQPGAMPDPDNYQAEAVPLGDATFWFIGEPAPSDPPNTPVFGLADEASKLNLNTASATMLEGLPGMTQDLAQAIVSWRASGTNSLSSAGASAATLKNAPFESIEELAQVNGGTDLDILYGTDTNFNHVQDANEAASGPTGFVPGLLEYVTVFSREPNTLSDGTKRINVTQTSSALTQLLNTTFGAPRGRQISRKLSTGAPPHSVLEFYIKSGMTSDEFAQISPKLTMSAGSFSYGLINVNTASETVLQCIPGITQGTAQQIVTTRTGQDPPPTNLAWVATILGPAASAQAGPFLTAETFQISADVAAVGHHGRGYRRTRFVIDSSNGAPQIIYRQNLAYLGWALGAAARQTLAQAGNFPSSSPRKETP